MVKRLATPFSTIIPQLGHTFVSQSLNPQSGQIIHELLVMEIHTLLVLLLVLNDDIRHLGLCQLMSLNGGINFVRYFLRVSVDLFRPETDYLEPAVL